MKTNNTLKNNFSANVGQKVATGALVLTTMLAPVGGKLGNVFGGTAYAQDSAHAATLPDDARAVPTRLPPQEQTVPPLQSEPKTGKLLSSDIRLWEGVELEDAPSAFSTGRMALILYGDNRQARGAAEYVGELIAKHKGVDVSFLWARDNDDNPNNVRIAGYANGLKYFELDVGSARTAKEIAQQLIPGMVKAYAAEFGTPKIAKTINTPSQGPGGID